MNNTNRKSSILLNKNPNKQILSGFTNPTNIAVIDENDEIEKSKNESFNEKDPLSLYIKWINLLQRDYFI